MLKGSGTINGLKIHSSTVYVESNSIIYVLNPTEITVTDVTGDGKLDYDDALIVAHDLYYPGATACVKTRSFL